MLKNLITSLLLSAGILLSAYSSGAQTQMSSKHPSFRTTADAGLSIAAETGSIRVSGDGFCPNESVTLSMYMPQTVRPEPLLVSRWQVMADASGAIAATWSPTAGSSRIWIRASGDLSGVERQARFSVGPDIIATHFAHLDQCRNGTVDTPTDCAVGQWANGDLNGAQAHYYEGDSVPFRLLLDNLVVGANNTVTLEWDSTESNHHAYDYLTTMNRTEPATNPCDGVAGCDPLVYSSSTIPVDPNVTVGTDGIAGTPDDITQIPGEFRLYGGTITSVSGYTLVHDFTTTSHTQITITFTATLADPVLSWGGHISTRLDWGVNNSAVAINGAPFHMRIFDINGEGGGNQDRGLQSSAVLFPANITIIKDTQPDSTTVFSFTTVGLNPVSFTLDDDGNSTNTYSNAQVFANLTSFAPSSVTVVENPLIGYRTSNIGCTSDPAGGTGTNNNIISIPAQSVEIVLEEGEIVTCTFTNQVVTAREASIAGRVVDLNTGRGIRNARLTLSAADGSYYSALTGPWGNYMFADVPVGATYVLSIASRRFSFTPDSMIVSLNDDVSGLDFFGTSYAR